MNVFFIEHFRETASGTTAENEKKLFWSLCYIINVKYKKIVTICHSWLKNLLILSFIHRKDRKTQTEIQARSWS